MSWKVHDTDDVFAALRGLCSNSYRMYDPSEYRYYYDHECETYECAVEDAASEYERLLRHCDHQREQLARYEKKEDGMDNIDGGTEIERIRSSSITDELREWVGCNLYYERRDELTAIADRIDAEHERQLEVLYRDMSDSEYVKLPVDADGEIWTGNERVFEVGNGTRYDMRYLMYDGEKWIIDSSFGGFIANECHHVQPDSWERIIGDALTVGWQNGNWNEVASAEIHERLVERCKRLAGE